MRVLLACEESAVCRLAFETLGWDAWSCDLLPSRVQGQHYQGDLFDILGCGWDLVIAFPPCTFIAVSGNRHYAGTPERRNGIAFVEKIWFFHGYDGALGIENPVGVLSTQSRLPVKPQYIQPWQFGHGETKKTGLWLRGLPELTPTNIVQDRHERIHKLSALDGPGSSKNRRRERSRTFPGIAAAMAEQWTAHLFPLPHP